MWLSFLKFLQLLALGLRLKVTVVLRNTIETKSIAVFLDPVSSVNF